MIQVATSVTVVYHDPSSDILLVGSLDFFLQAFDCKQRLGNTVSHDASVGCNKCYMLQPFYTETSFGLISSKIQFWTSLVQNQEKLLWALAMELSPYLR